MIYNLEFCINSNYYGKTGELPHQIHQTLHLGYVACMGNLHSKLQIVTIRNFWQIALLDSSIVTSELSNIHGEFMLKFE